MDKMRLNVVEIGERYSDDSGWERRVTLNRQKNILDIEIQASLLTVPLNELQWLLEALRKVKDTLAEQEGSRD